MITIYDIQGTAKLSVEIGAGSKRRFLMMEEDSITLNFSLYTPVYFHLGDWCQSDGRRYELTEIQVPKYNRNTGGYDYQLRMDAYYWKWVNKLFKFIPEQTGGREESWNLTATLDVHMGIFLRNLAALGYKYNGQSFAYYIDQDKVQNTARLVQYSTTNLLDALTAMAETWECEWWVDGKTIHFGKNEVGTSIDLNIGAEIYEMSENNSNEKKPTRIYAFGSERNIPVNYRPVSQQTTISGVVQRRLMLPEDTPYIDTDNNLAADEAVETTVVFEDVYPRLESKVTKVSHTEGKYVDEDGNPTGETYPIYQIQEAVIKDFKESYIFEGKELRIKFQDGLLAGMDFAVTLIDSDPNGTIWEIVRNEDYGRFLPDETLHPSLNDTYMLYNYDVTYLHNNAVALAEQELKTRAQEYAEQLKQDETNIDITLNSLWAKDHALQFGQKVKVINPAIFKEGHRESRVIGFEVALDIPNDHPVYTIGLAPSYGRTRSLENSVDDMNVTINKISQRKVDVDLSKYKTWAQTLAKLGLTTIEGGYILTNMIELTDNEHHVMAGINGLYNPEAQGGGAAAWYGGEMDAANILFRFDGSGYVAGGHLSWDKAGIVTLPNGAKVGGTKVTLGEVAEWTDLFEKVNIGTQVTPKWAIRAKFGLYSDDFISAYGQNSEGGGGSGVNLLLDWSTPYDNTFALSAALGVELKNRLDNIKVQPAWTDIVDPPTTLAGYGITDAVSAASFTKAGIQTTLCIADWALATARPSYAFGDSDLTGFGSLAAKSSLAFSDITGSVAFSQLPTMYWANVAVSSKSSNDTTPTFGSVKVGGATISWDATNQCLKIDKGFVSESFISAYGVNSSGGGGGGSVASIRLNGEIYTDTDGVVTLPNVLLASHPANGVTDARIGNWDTAFGWGNHASAGYASASSLSNYLPLSGGTMKGGITLVGNYYKYNDRFGIDCNNSDIIGANSIYFGDLSDASSEAIRFYRDSTHYDSLTASSGVLYFKPNDILTGSSFSECEKIYHTGFKPSAVDVGALPIEGGTLTGDIAYKGSRATYTMIAFKNNTSDVNGNGIVIGGGGLAIIGGGESASVVSGQHSSGGDENMVVCNDGAIDFISNLQNGWGSGKSGSFDTSGYWNGVGFKKANSSDSYVLLGGGGHKAESSLSVSYAVSAGSASANDVYSWAKASSKPSYGWTEITGKPTLFTANKVMRYGMQRQDPDYIKGLADSSLYYIIQGNGRRILHMSWDTGNYDTQIMFPDYVYSVGDKIDSNVRWRSNGPSGNWSEWLCFYDTHNCNNSTTDWNCLNLNASADIVAYSKGTKTNKVITNSPQLSASILCHKTDTGCSISFGVGNGGTNRGVWCEDISSWLLYINSSNYSTLNVDYVHASANILSNGEITAYSDIRKKDVISNRHIPLGLIANAPLFDYKWNDREDKEVHLGSSAQYWLGVTPELVLGSEDTTYSLNYGTLGVACAISLAKHVMSHEERIKQLEDELAELRGEINVEQVN